MLFRRRTVAFASLAGSGPSVQPFTEVFPRNVVSAAAGIAGFSAGFDAPNDRQLGLLDVGAVASIDANTVSVDLSFGLRDWSGDWDDEYAGVVDVVVLAELEPPGAAAPRADLQITGVEISQVTQFFRSGDHLDAANVMPDNSIPLIASKPTGVRVYVDYDDTLGLPPIASLSGELEVQTTTGTSVIAPVSAIMPRRNSAIDRGQWSHTLNFVLPADLSRNDVSLRCRVFDEADPTQFSSPVTRSARFREAEEVRLFVVGVNYTGQGLTLPAPSLATFLNDVTLLESAFPTPDVVITGYATISNFNVDMNATTPCAQGFSALNALIADLKGDSDDIYVGAVPAGVNFGLFSGCASSGVASGSVGSPPILAHEVGHRFGRRHAPCDAAGRCNNPANQDPDYPRYGNYLSDSIGEYGLDPINSRVFDPATSFDLMGYTNTNSWVSPYTYIGLMERTAPTPGAFGGGQARGLWQRVKTMTLFLDLQIDLDRHVRRRPSFHFPAVPDPGTRRRHCGCGEERGEGFTLEFLDDCHRVLACHALQSECGCGDDCWPRAFRSATPLPDDAHWLVVREGRTKLYEECISTPPVVSLDCNPVADGSGFRLDWAVAWPTDDSQVDRCEVWFLVQWEDIDGTWRGLMPRTREHNAEVPARLFGGRQSMRVRVLATSGVATGSAQCLLGLPERPPRSIDVVLVANAGSNGPEPVPAVPLDRGGVRAWALDEAGRTVANPGFVWFDGAGHEIARGPRLTPREVRDTDVVRLQATALLTRRDAPAPRRWALRRTGRRLVLEPGSTAQPDEPTKPPRPPRPPRPTKPRPTKPGGRYPKS